VASITWWHRIDVGDGEYTPGGCGGMGNLRDLDVRGQSVLDIGAWDGYYSFACEQMGASDVLATDSYVWPGQKPGCSQAGFLCARRLLGSTVRDQVIDVMDLSPEAIGGSFDIVLCLGLLYHMRHPLLALERVRAVTKSRLVLETHYTPIPGPPTLRFYEDDELHGDPTNWFDPNPTAVLALLRSAGFVRPRILADNGDRLLVHADV
jgi:tRNA (mo5U34)-methyltransferase